MPHLRKNGRNAEEHHPTADTCNWIARQIGGGAWWIRSDAAGSPWLDDLGDPELWTVPPARQLTQNLPGKRTAVFHCPAKGIRPECVLKRYATVGVREMIKAWFRTSLAVRVFQRAQELRREGILTAAPIAAGEYRRFGYLCRSYLVSEYVAHSRTLRSIRPPHPALWPGTVLMHGLGSLMGRMHQAGWIHNDPTLGNFLVVDPAGGEALSAGTEPTLVLVDLDTLRHKQTPKLPERIKDLQKLLRRCPMADEEFQHFMKGYVAFQKGDNARMWAQTLESARAKFHANL